MVYVDTLSDKIVQYNCLVQFEDGTLQHFAAYRLNYSRTQGSIQLIVL